MILISQNINLWNTLMSSRPCQQRSNQIQRSTNHQPISFPENFPTLPTVHRRAKITYVKSQIRILEGSRFAKTILLQLFTLFFRSKIWPRKIPNTKFCTLWRKLPVFDFWSNFSSIRICLSRRFVVNFGRIKWHFYIFWNKIRVKGHPFDLFACK